MYGTGFLMRKAQASISSLVSLHASSLSPHRPAFFHFLDPPGESQESPKILLLFLSRGGSTGHKERLIGSTGSAVYLLRSSLQWTKGIVTEYKTVFQRSITPVPMSRIKEAIHREVGREIGMI